MTIEERQAIVKELYNEAETIMLAKGKSYAGTGQDSLANFKRNADRLGLTPFQVCVSPSSLKVSSQAFTFLSPSTDKLMILSVSSDCFFCEVCFFAIGSSYKI